MVVPQQTLLPSDFVEMNVSQFPFRWIIFLVFWVGAGLWGFYFQDTGKLKYLLSKVNLLGITTSQGFTQRRRNELDIIEHFWVDSWSPYSIQEILNGASPKARARVAGSILIPDVRLRMGKSDPVPAVVFIPMSAGALKDRDRERLELLNSMGIATVVFDSFSPRNVYGWTGHHPERLSNAMVLSDAFAVLRYVRSNYSKRVDTAKIAVLGASKGGEVALLAGWRPLIEKLDPSGSGFAAHLAYYPFCYSFELPHFTSAPVIMFIGAMDNWALPESCYQFRTQFAENGGEIVAKVYQDAYHGFDSLTPLRVIDGPYSREKCDWRIGSDGSIFDTKLGLNQNSFEAAQTANRSCGEKGRVKIGGNLEAKRQSYLDLIEFLKKTFGP